MLEKWETPRVTIQEFEPNEYVAACWYIACEYGIHNLEDPRSGNLHQKGSDGLGCGWADNQVIRDNPDGTFSIREEDGYLEDYDMEMTKNSDYTGLSRTLANVNANDTIYWITKSSDGSQKWFHYGTVVNPTPDHPNRS